MKTLLELLVGATVGLLIALIILALNEEPDSRFEHLDIKFGTPTLNDAKFDPIVHLADNKKRVFCTAFIIDANYAATAGHCVNSKDKYYPNKLTLLDEAGNQVAEAQAVGYHNRSDLGLLKGDFKKFKVLKAEFHHAEFQLTPMALTCGYPYGQNKLICNLFHTVGNVEFMVAGKGYLVPGMSGGPVISPSTGLAIGVNHAVDENYAYVRPLQGFLGVFQLD
jgi:S1-C subfamily serine protease